MKKILFLICIAFNIMALERDESPLMQDQLSFIYAIYDKNFEKAESLIAQGFAYEKFALIQRETDRFSVNTLQNEQLEDILYNISEVSKSSDIEKYPNIRSFIEHSGFKAELKQFDLIYAAKDGDPEAVKKHLLVSNQKQIKRALYWAIRNGHLKIVETLIDNGADLSADNFMSYAAKYGHLDIVKLLNTKIPAYSKRNFSDYAPIVHATMGAHDTIIKGVHYYIIEFLLENGANVHSNGDLALREACERGLLSIAELLLAHGADVDNEALTLAAGNGHADVVTLLIEKGANVDTSNYGKFPLRAAIEGGHANIAKILLDNKANVHAYEDIALRKAISKGNVKLIELLVNSGARTSNLIIWAVEQGQIELVRLLISEGFDPNSEMAAEAIHSAAKANNIEVAKLLYEIGCNPFIVTYHESAFSEAAKRDNMEMVTLFIKDKLYSGKRYFENYLEDEFARMIAHNYGTNAICLIIKSDPDICTSSYGKAILESAARKGKIEVVKQYLDSGLLTYPDLAGNTLIDAGYSGNVTLVQLLLDAQIPINHTNRHTSIIDSAARYGHAELVKYILSNGFKGKTEWALAHAAETGYLDIVEMLIQAGVDIHAYEHQALKWAIGQKRAKIVSLLLNTGEYSEANLKDVYMDGSWDISALTIALGDQEMTNIMLQSAIRLYKKIHPQLSEIEIMKKLFTDRVFKDTKKKK